MLFFTDTNQTWEFFFSFSKSTYLHGKMNENNRLRKLGRLREQENKERKKIDNHIDMRIVKLTLLFIKCSFVTVTISIALTQHTAIAIIVTQDRHTHTHIQNQISAVQIDFFSIRSCFQS